eukprot:4114449-Pleurochrysis_carterae.AAC.1
MPHYGLMCRSLRDTAFFAKYASRRTKSSVDEYAGFPNALAVTRALNAIQDAAEHSPGRSHRRGGDVDVDSETPTAQPQRAGRHA